MEIYQVSDHPLCLFIDVKLIHHYRHLYLSEPTLALLQQYQRFRDAECQTATEAAWQETDLKELFPRIELLSVAKDVIGRKFASRKHSGVDLYEQDLRVVLFKPVTINDLQSLCLPFNSDAKSSSVCMFGIQVITPFDEDSGWLFASHIMDLTVCSDAGILAPGPTSLVNRQGQGLRINKTDQMMDFTVKIRNPTDDSLTRSTISFVLDFARAGRYSGDFESMREIAPTLDLRCHSSVLEAFNEIVSIGSLLSVRIVQVS